MIINKAIESTDTQTILYIDQHQGWMDHITFRACRCSWSLVGSAMFQRRGRGGGEERTSCGPVEDQQQHLLLWNKRNYKIIRSYPLIPMAWPRLMIDT